MEKDHFDNFNNEKKYKKRNPSEDVRDNRTEEKNDNVRDDFVEFTKGTYKRVTCAQTS